jgi:hypothetical protein
MADKYSVGQSIIVKINGVPHESTVKAVLQSTDGLKLIIDFGHEQTATVSERDIVTLED